MLSKKSNKSSRNKSRKSNKRTKSNQVSKKTKTNKKLGKLSRNKFKISKKRTKKNRKKIYKNIVKGGGGRTDDELLDYIYYMAKYINLPFKIIKKYKDVGMGGVHISKHPILTTGIFTCTGIGFTKNSINYFSHASSSDLVNTHFIDEWKILLNQYTPEIIYIYRLYQMLCPLALPFYRMLEEINMLDKITIVGLDNFNQCHYTETVEDEDICFPDVFDSNYKIGISNEGPVGFVYDICQDFDKDKCLKRTKREKHLMYKKCQWSERLTKCEVKRKEWK